MPNIYSKTGALHSIRVKKQASRVLLYHKFMLFFLGGEECSYWYWENIREKLVATLRPLFLT